MVLYFFHEAATGAIIPEVVLERLKVVWIWLNKQPIEPEHYLIIETIDLLDKETRLFILARTPFGHDPISNFTCDYPPDSDDRFLAVDQFLGEYFIGHHSYRAGRTVRQLKPNNLNFDEFVFLANVVNDKSPNSDSRVDKSPYWYASSMLDAVLEIFGFDDSVSPEDAAREVRYQPHDEPDLPQMPGGWEGIKASNTDPEELSAIVQTYKREYPQHISEVNFYSSCYSLLSSEQIETANRRRKNAEVLSRFDKMIRQENNRGRRGDGEKTTWYAFTFFFVFGYLKLMYPAIFLEFPGPTNAIIVLSSLLPISSCAVWDTENRRVSGFYMYNIIYCSSSIQRCMKERPQ